MRRGRMLFWLVGPPCIAWVLAYSGSFVSRGWLAVPFRDISHPKVLAVNLLPGEGAPDVVTSVGIAAQVVLAALLSALIAEISKLGWLVVRRRSAGSVPAPWVGYLLLLGFQLALVRDAARYGHFHWWTWLLWQLRLTELPAPDLATNHFVAFLPSFVMLFAAIAAAVWYLAREREGSVSHAGQ